MAIFLVFPQILMFDHSSPVHPISESRVGGLMRVTKDGRNSSCLILDFSESVDFPNRWKCIGKGLRLQPAPFHTMQGIRKKDLILICILYILYNHHLSLILSQQEKIVRWPAQ